VNHPSLLREILADEIHAAAAEHYALAAAEQTHAEAEAAARASSLADAVTAAAPPVEQAAAGFAEVESAGNSAEATAHPALPEAHSGAGSPAAEPVGKSDASIPAYRAEGCFPAVHTAHSSVAAPADYSSAAAPVHDLVWLTADVARCACHDPASPDGCCLAADLRRDYWDDLLGSLSPVRAARFLPAVDSLERFAEPKAGGHSFPAGSPGCYSPVHWDARHTAAAYHHAGRCSDFHQAGPRFVAGRF